MSNTANSGVRPIYFYSSVKDLCSARGFTFSAPNNTDYGDLCVYIDAGPTTALWACPAGDEKCWTTQKPCFGGGLRQPSKDQTLCSSGANTQWCCNAVWEDCAIDSTKTGICWAKTFDNPLEKVEPSLASRIAKEAIAAKETGVMLTVPTVLSADPTTTSISNLDITSIHISASKSFTLTSAFGLTDTLSTGVGGAAATSLNTEPAMPSSKLSRGTIAGIVIAATGIAMLVGIVAFFIYRRKKRTQGPVLQELPSDSDVGLLPPPMVPAPAAVSESSLTMATVKQEPSPGGLQEKRDPETVRSQPEADIHNLLENESIISALEPSPLQTLMIHGRYPHR